MPTKRNSGIKVYFDALSNTISSIQTGMAVHTEILKRVEDKVTKTNGKVAEIEEWRIDHCGQLKVMKAGMILLFIPVVLIFIKEFVASWI